MFKNIHPNSYNTVARAHTDTNGMQEFYFIWPLLKSSILTWIKYGYSSILYAQLVLPTVNNFNWKINTGCLDRDKKKWLKRSYIISKVEDIDTICCLYLEFRVHCNVVSEGYYVLLQRESYTFKSEAARYGTQWTKVHVTCIKTKHK